MKQLVKKSVQSSFFILLAFVICVVLFEVTEVVQEKSIVENTALPFEVQEVAYQKKTYTVVIVNPAKVSIDLYHKNEQGDLFESIASLKQHFNNTQKRLLFAINGGIFDKEFNPKGLYIENGKMLYAVDTAEGNGNFYIKPNGVFAMRTSTAEVRVTKDFVNTGDIKYAVQSGPILVSAGKVNDAFNKDSANTYIRNGIGINRGGHVVFVISNEPVTFFEFASLFKMSLECDNALYLDGAISEMYIDGYREEIGNSFASMIGIIQ